MRTIVTRLLALILLASAPAFAQQQINLTTQVKGILPTANGGTGMAYFTAAGPTVARIYTFPDAAATILYSGGPLGTPSSGTLTSATGLPISTGVSGLGTGVATALAINVGSAGAPVVFNGALGTPSSGVATNLTGTAASLTAGNVTTNANLTGAVTSSGNATSLGSFATSALNTALNDNDVTTLAGTETLTNKRITKRALAASDNLSLAVNADSYDDVYQTNTQALSTLDIPNPTGTPSGGDTLIYSVKSTNAHVLTFGTQFRFSVSLTAPATLSGASLTDKLRFKRSYIDAKWDFDGVVSGF